MEIFLLDTILEQYVEANSPGDRTGVSTKVDVAWLSECPTGYIVVSDQIKVRSLLVFRNIAVKI